MHRLVRVIVSLIAFWSWLVFLVVVNPILFRFGDVHNWHGTDYPEWATNAYTIATCTAIALSVAIAFGAPRSMLWPVLALTLFVTFVRAAPAVPRLISGLNYWYHDDPIPGRMFLLWTYLSSAVGMCISSIGYSVLCYWEWRRERPNQSLQPTVGRSDV
jgi:hypothetical protein